MSQNTYIVLFLLIATSSATTFLSSATYNETLANKFWHLCMGSYCAPSRIASWDLGMVSDLYPSVTDITLVINSTGNACGFTAYNPDEDEVLIVFRGTEPLSIKNWIDDLDTFYTDYPACSGCKVHEGFYHTYLDIRATILSSAKRLFSKYPNSRKLVTGHSLGGALAVHASIDIINNFGEIDEYYTYGSPRVGNQAFTDYVNGKIKGNFNSRITHNRDPVPHLPFEKWGFIHIDTEVFYNEASSSYRICQKGEDENCSNGQLDLNVLDHLNYMGQDITLYMIKCQI